MRLSDFVIPPWVKPAFAAVALAAAFGAGWTTRGWYEDAQRLDAVQKAEADEDKAEEHANNEATEYEQVRDQSRVDSRAREIQIREVFRDVEVPGNCAAPPAVRSVLQRAVDSANLAGQPGAAVPDTAESASGVERP